MTNCLQLTENFTRGWEVFTIGIEGFAFSFSSSFSSLFSSFSTFSSLPSSGSRVSTGSTELRRVDWGSGGWVGFLDVTTGEGGGWSGRSPGPSCIPTKGGNTPPESRLFQYTTLTRDPPMSTESGLQGVRLFKSGEDNAISENTQKTEISKLKNEQQ